MHKYIAVVNHRMDDDEISKLIAKDIAGAIFQISHNNYPLASQLIRKVKVLAAKRNRPVSIIQDVSEMTDPMDLEFGIKSGVDWVIATQPKHVDIAKRFKKHIPVIWKGKDKPNKVKVDSLMQEKLDDPDALVGDFSSIKHFGSDHPKKKTLQALLEISKHTQASDMITTDLDMAKLLSSMRPKHKIFFSPKNDEDARIANLFWGVYPVAGKNNWYSDLKNKNLIKVGDRLIDMTDPEHVNIHLVI